MFGFMKYKRTTVNYRKIAEEYYGVSVEGMHVHHKDGNCHNNNPENLVICTAEEHAEYHKNLGQTSISEMLLGQGTGNWFSAIGTLGGLSRKGSTVENYNVSDLALDQRKNARSSKGDQTNTKISLRGSGRTENQKAGDIKKSISKSTRVLSDAEKTQLSEFTKAGHAASKLACTGSKKLINIETGEIKFAIPNSDKWNRLINLNFILK